MTATYQTRVSAYASVERAAGDAALSAYADLYGKVQRKLFAEAAAGRPPSSMKSAYLKEHRIPARMFNSVRASLNGKIAAVRESQKLHRETLQHRIARAVTQIYTACGR